MLLVKMEVGRGDFRKSRIATEAISNATETVFVMEYLHESLADAAVDFRIIHDVTGKGRFARWEDVAGIEDLQSATVFYHEPQVDPDLLTVIHEFTEEGDYIGRLTDYLLETELDPDSQVFLCGNSNMIFDAMDILRARGIPQKQISTEVYF